MAKYKVTERTYYPILIDIIKKFGGSAVQEIKYNSQPDIVFNLVETQWILSVKIGEDPKILKDGFIQYMRHKEESNISNGILLLLPESVRKVAPEEEILKNTIQSSPVSVLLDTPLIKEELRGRLFEDIISVLKQDILERLQKKEKSYFSINFVISLLKEQVAEMMKEIELDKSTVLEIITDKKLLMNIGNLKPKESEYITYFLASFIFMSQLLFLRLFISQQPQMFSEPIRPVTHHTIRKAFRKILEINYKPVFSVDVLDSIPEKFLHDTFDLIWGLEIENVRYDLPGRIFHELMPEDIRKMLAAFYTRPYAADILTRLTIDKSNNKVFDPACGSGTILVSAYRTKLDMFRNNKNVGNPHKRFCEEEIFGADIMPFAVHLTSANLASIDTGTTIDRTQIILKDSLKLGPGKVYDSGIDQLSIFPETPEAETIEGDLYKVSLKKVDTILMNPPFTKIERGIRKFVNLEQYTNRCGGEVGLWGHFIALSDSFLKNNGLFGAVIPINILRGRESSKVRSLLFKEWTPIYIIKSTKNYGFSEWAEYRDILFVARKKKPDDSTRIKFCLIKKDLTSINENDVNLITSNLKEKEYLRSKIMDIDSYNLNDVIKRFDNLMWFESGVSFSLRDRIISFVDKFKNNFGQIPSNYFSEGYRPVPKGVSKFIFLTRDLNNSRIREAFLFFDSENKLGIKAKTHLNTIYNFNASVLTPSLRTIIGHQKMDITDKFDYLIHEPNNEMKRLFRATGFKTNSNFNWIRFWANIENEKKTKMTNLVVSHRINPFSPSTSLIAFFSEKKILPSNQVHIVNETDKNYAKAMCVLFNSIIFLSQFFLLKEESTGRFINIRFYDLNQMYIYPKKNFIDDLVKIYNKYKNIDFPSLSLQFDTQFSQRYNEFFKSERKANKNIFSGILSDDIEPHKSRLSFDLDICNAIGLDTSDLELKNLYSIFVEEMMIIKSLKRD